MQVTKCKVVSVLGGDLPHSRNWKHLLLSTGCLRNLDILRDTNSLKINKNKNVNNTTFLPWMISFKSLGHISLTFSCFFSIVQKGIVCSLISAYKQKITGIQELRFQILEMGKY